MQNRNDFDTFFEKYFATIQKLFSLNNDQMNEANTYFERHANIILEIQSKSFKQRNKILEVLIRALKLFFYNKM